MGNTKINKGVFDTKVELEHAGVATVIEIREAAKSQAAEIASLIMTAMTDDC